MNCHWYCSQCKTTHRQYVVSSMKHNHTVYALRSFQVIDTPGDDIERRLSSPVDRHVDSIAKYNYALHRQLGNIFNFTYVCIASEQVPRTQTISSCTQLYT